MATLEIESNWISKINNTLLNCTIPLKVTEIRQTPGNSDAIEACKIDETYLQQFKSTCPNMCEYADENSAHYRVNDTRTNELVAFVGVDFSDDKCAYVNYRCTHKLRRGKGIGTFLGFIAVTAAEKNNMNVIFSQGLGDKLDLTNNADFKNYKRSGWDTEGKKKMVISQYLNIVKLGFQDNYEGTDTEFKKKIKDFGEKCKNQDPGDAETVLYLRDPIKNQKWKNYEKNFYNKNSTNLPKYPYTNKKEHENRIQKNCSSIFSMTDLAKEIEVIKNEDENSGKKKSKNGGKKKTTKVRKHQGIIQTGGNAGRLRKGYRYSGKKLKSGLPQIIKCKSKKC